MQVICIDETLCFGVHGLIVSVDRIGASTLPCVSSQSLSLPPALYHIQHNAMCRLSSMVRIGSAIWRSPVFSNTM